jgi:hypothetical protein
MILAFNVQSWLFVAGLVTVVTGVWIKAGTWLGLVALGTSLITSALIINQNDNEKR